MKQLNIKLLIAAVCISILTHACKPVPPVQSVQKSMNPGTMTDPEKHYLQAYLAYAVDAQIDEVDYWKSESHAIDYFNTQAKDNIHGALINRDVYTPFGSYEMVWEPSVKVDYIGALGDKAEYVVQNLMYCLKITGPNNSAKYLIGIAGTDELSPNDWFDEDLSIIPMQAWPYGKGKISKGSMDGFNIINKLESGGATLFNFLKEDIKTNRSSVISVAGHSLGGALTQVYASFLRDQIKNGRVAVESWVYAGPSAGDSNFAKELISQLGKENYHAFNNRYDVIPHAWETTKLDELCDIYSNFSLCGISLGKNVYMNSVIEYFKEKSQYLNFTTPGTPISFSGTPLTVQDCRGFDHKIDVLRADLDLDDDLDDIYNKCVYPYSSTVDSFFYILAELGYQHTSAYYSQFLASQSPGFHTAIKEAVPTANLGVSSIWEGKDVLSTFLGRVADREFTGCSCQ